MDISVDLDNGARTQPLDDELLAVILENASVECSAKVRAEVMHILEEATWWSKWWRDFTCFSCRISCQRAVMVSFLLYFFSKI